jgi:hypothetical protein
MITRRNFLNGWSMRPQSIRLYPPYRLTHSCKSGGVILLSSSFMLIVVSRFVEFGFAGILGFALGYGSLVLGFCLGVARSSNLGFLLKNDSLISSGLFADWRADLLWVSCRSWLAS